jgi:hypothetical protein
MTAQKAYFAISIDVEPDCTPTWHYSKPLTFDGVRVGIKERLQPLFDKFGACPTYLINNVVMEDRESVEVFQGLEGRFELGAHLHCEFIEPEKKVFDYGGSKGEANQCFLPPEIEFAKLQSITRMFSDRFGRTPTSFRAGRFSAGGDTIASLAKLGYKVDTSVTPNVTWKDRTRESAVDYSACGAQPYYVDPESFPAPAKAGRILEVPVSIHVQRKLFGKDRTVWLRPVYSSFKEIAALMKAFSRRHASEPILVFNMMFHNVEVLPAKSPYCQNEKDCAEYLSFLEKFLAACRDQGLESVGLSDLHGIYAGRR